MNTDWQVLLIGGASGTGKSHLARQLAEYYKVPLTEIDDIRIALQQMAEREKHPNLFTFVDNKDFLNEFSEEEFVSKLLAVGEAIWPALDALIEKHVRCNERVIFEGDGIVPELLANRSQDYIKSIFLHDELESMQERMTNRNRYGTEHGKAEKQAAFAHAYSEVIKQQSEANGFRTIPVSPIETLFTRCIEL